MANKVKLKDALETEMKRRDEEINQTKEMKKKLIREIDGKSIITFNYDSFRLIKVNFLDENNAVETITAFCNEKDIKNGVLPHIETYELDNRIHSFIWGTEYTLVTNEFYDSIIKYANSIRKSYLEEISKVFDEYCYKQHIPTAECYLERNQNATLDEYLKYKDIVEEDKINIKNMKGKYYIFSYQKEPLETDYAYAIVNGNNFELDFNLKTTTMEIKIGSILDTAKLDRCDFDHIYNYNRQTIDQYINAHMVEITELQYNRIIKAFEDIRNRYKALLKNKMMPLKKNAKTVYKY